MNITHAAGMRLDAASMASGSEITQKEEKLFDIYKKLHGKAISEVNDMPKLFLDGTEMSYHLLYCKKTGKIIGILLYEAFDGSNDLTAVREIEYDKRECTALF
ncbi:MAG: hypothetical protein QXW10_03295, partial [Candidatus Micrarchaeaceae archaeon]